MMVRPKRGAAAAADASALRAPRAAAAAAASNKQCVGDAVYEYPTGKRPAEEAAAAAAAVSTRRGSASKGTKPPPADDKKPARGGAAAARRKKLLAAGVDPPPEAEAEADATSVSNQNAGCSSKADIAVAASNAAAPKRNTNTTTTINRDRDRDSISVDRGGWARAGGGGVSVSPIVFGSDGGGGGGDGGGGGEVFLPVSAFELNPNADLAVAATAAKRKGPPPKRNGKAVAAEPAVAVAVAEAEVPSEAAGLTAHISTPVPAARGRKRKGSVGTDPGGGLSVGVLENPIGELVAGIVQGVDNITDLGPPLPAALKIKTDFKRKKGYFYDPITTPMGTPSREAEDEFKSCLLELHERTSPLLDSASKMSRTFVLQRALSVEELNDDSWLSSSLIDLCFSRFARSYDSVDFLPVDFAVMLSLPSSNASELFNATDILGRKLCYEKKRPMLLLYNAKNIHWILIKVQLTPMPELQLFEPMGQPTNHKRGMSYRIVPRDVVRWLDTCCPLPDKSSWLSKALSAITSQQQFTSFDCGVACLLYAEKCGQNQVN
jgi:hypothetical protein